MASVSLATTVNRVKANHTATLQISGSGGRSFPVTKNIATATADAEPLSVNLSFFPFNARAIQLVYPKFQICLDMTSIAGAATQAVLLRAVCADTQSVLRATQPKALLQAAKKLYNNTDSASATHKAKGGQYSDLRTSSELSTTSRAELHTAKLVVLGEHNASTQEYLQPLGIKVSPSTPRQPLREYATATSKFLYGWGGLAPDDWVPSDLKKVGLMYDMLSQSGITFTRVAPVNNKPILDMVWQRRQNGVKLTASFAKFDLSTLSDQGFLVWQTGQTSSKIFRVDTEEFREFWSRRVRGLTPGTNYQAIAYVVSNGLLILSSTQAFVTRKSPTLFDLMTPYIKFEDANLGGDLEGFMEILQLTIDQSESTVAESLALGSVDEIPEEFLANLAADVGTSLDKYLSVEDNRLAIKEFMPWVGLKGSNLSFEVIFNRLQMASKVVNQATRIIVPSYQGRLSYEDANFMDRYYFHDGSLDVQATWFGSDGSQPYPDVERIWEGLEKVWPAGFLLWLTIRIALTTPLWENWLDIGTQVCRTHDFTFVMPAWPDEARWDSNLSDLMSMVRDFEVKLNSAVPIANSTHFTLMSRTDGNQKRPLNSANTALADLEEAREHSIPFRPSVRVEMRPSDLPVPQDTYFLSGYIGDTGSTQETAYAIRMPYPILVFNQTRWGFSRFPKPEEL